MISSAGMSLASSCLGDRTFEKGPTMMEIRDESQTDRVTIDVRGKLTKEDYDRFVPKFERLADNSGPLRLLIVLEDFQGWEPAALWEDVKFDVSHQDSFLKIAIVGKKDWEKWGTKLSKPFFDAPMRFFEQEDIAKAKEWLGE